MGPCRLRARTKGCSKLQEFIEDIQAIFVLGFELDQKDQRWVVAQTPGAGGKSCFRGVVSTYAAEAEPR